MSRLKMHLRIRGTRRGRWSTWEDQKEMGGLRSMKKVNCDKEKESRDNAVWHSVKFEKVIIK